MEFLIGNPFSTPVGQRIEHATSPSLQSEDWALNMEICDIINESEDGPKDAVKAIKKRIVGNKNFREVMLALTVLEACVKNCGHRLHVLVSTREFVEGVLVRTILPKNNPPLVLHDRVLSIIQAWADAFRSSPALTGVVSVYEDLRRKGLEFPMMELEGYSPIHTPGRVKKLRADLVVVRGNLTLMSDMMSHQELGSVNHRDMELLQQLYGVCKDMQDRIVELIPRLSEEQLIEELLAANDDINTTFTRYHRFEQQMSNGQNTNEQSPTYVNLIDLNPNVEAINQVECADAPPHSHLSPSTVDIVSSQMSKLTTTEADDSFLQKRSMSLDQQSQQNAGAAGLDQNPRIPASVTDDSTDSTLLGCSPPFDWMVVKGMIPVSQTSVMDDIEKWLDVDEDDDLSEEGVTSAEFDKFLAERARAAERLPSLKTSSNTKQPQP